MVTDVRTFRKVAHQISPYAATDGGMALVSGLYARVVLDARHFDMRTRITFLVLHLARVGVADGADAGWTPPLSAGDVAAIVGCQRIPVRRVLTALVDEGYLDRQLVSRWRGCGGERFMYRPAWEISDLRGGAA